MSFYCLFPRNAIQDLPCFLYDAILDIIFEFCENNLVIFDEYLRDGCKVLVISSCSCWNAIITRKEASQTTALSTRLLRVLYQKENEIYMLDVLGRYNTFANFQTSSFLFKQPVNYFEDLFQTWDPINELQIDLRLTDRANAIVEYQGNIFAYWSGSPSKIKLFKLKQMNNNNLLNRYKIKGDSTVSGISYFNYQYCILLNCNNCLYLCGQLVGQNRNRSVLFKLQFIPENKNIVKHKMPTMECGEFIFARVVHETSKKILFFGQNNLYAFDCKKNVWCQSEKYVKSIMKPYRDVMTYIRTMNNTTVIAPFHNHIIYFPLWACKCLIQPSKCNSYNILLRKWKVCKNIKTFNSQRCGFLFI